MDRLAVVRKTIEGLSFLHPVGEIQQGACDIITGTIDVDTEEGSPRLRWQMLIQPTYPQTILGHETIHFINKDLVDYPHVMQDGNLCMHTYHAYELADKLEGDLKMLKHWVDKYYVQKEKDGNYEHLVVNTYPVADTYYHLLFADTEQPFEEGDFGRFVFGAHLRGHKRGKDVVCYSTVSFKSVRRMKSDDNKCQWQAYRSLISPRAGLYCFLKEQPAIYGKFIVEDYQDLASFLTQQQINYLNAELRSGDEKCIVNGHVFVIVGYRIPSGEVHWQALMMPLDDLPFEVNKIRMPNSRHNLWLPRFKHGAIKWVETENTSYEHFFGRGAFPKQITESNILIIGVGAVGSMVAVALARGGVRRMTICDFDDKKAGNICRSEYIFMTGVGAKVDELCTILTAISPFLECVTWEDQLDELVKTKNLPVENKKQIIDLLNGYDVIFDCSTDNDMMNSLEVLGLDCQMINLSITNHARELVCAFSPGIVGYVEAMFNLLRNDTDDVYSPSGCWSPTFKANYTDISCMVQLAMKHLVKMLAREEEVRNFIIEDTNDGLRIRRQ